MERREGVCFSREEEERVGEDEDQQGLVLARTVLGKEDSQRSLKGSHRLVVENWDCRGPLPSLVSST